MAPKVPGGLPTILLRLWLRAVTCRHSFLVSKGTADFCPILSQSATVMVRAKSTGVRGADPYKKGDWCLNFGDQRPATY